MDAYFQGLRFPLRTLLLLSLGTLFCADAATFRVELFAGSLNRPVMLASPPGDMERVFIVEQHSGYIRIHDAETGGVIAPNFLRVTGITTGGEQGLLGLAFHPNYAENGYFYVNYTTTGGGPAGHTEIARFQATGDPATSITADPGSRTVILTYDQPQANHNAGWMGFGLDGYLYIASGDGGSGDDPHGLIGNGQDRTSLLGKILRIDVDSAEPYAIPDGNPFKDHATYAEEIWAFGLRNPWRCSFDRETGDLWIGDVGQAAREEIDFNPAGVGGLNFGWRPREGSIQNPSFPSESPVTPATDPVFDYSRSFGYSVTGGYVYRGSRIPELQGKYILADYGTARFWVITHEGDDFSAEERTADFSAPNLDDPSSFGEDGAGELYICDLGGRVFKIVPVLPPPPEIGAAVLLENNFVFTFEGDAGIAYAIESRSAVGQGTWTTVHSLPPADVDGPISVTNELSAGTEFFRVRIDAE